MLVRGILLEEEEEEEKGNLAAVEVVVVVEVEVFSVELRFSRSVSCVAEGEVRC